MLLRSQCAIELGPIGNHLSELVLLRTSNVCSRQTSSAGKIHTLEARADTNFTIVTKRLIKWQSIAS